MNNRPICKYFPNGSCYKGNACPFYHQKSNEAVPKVYTGMAKPVIVPQTIPKVYTGMQKTTTTAQTVPKVYAGIQKTIALIQGAPKVCDEMKSKTLIQDVPSKITIELLDKHFDNFTKLDADDLRNIMGELLYPEIKYILDEIEQDYKKNIKNEDIKLGNRYTPKITGMIADIDALSDGKGQYEACCEFLSFMKEQSKNTLRQYIQMCFDVLWEDTYKGCPWKVKLL